MRKNTLSVRNRTPKNGLSHFRSSNYEIAEIPAKLILYAAPENQESENSTTNIEKEIPPDSQKNSQEPEQTSENREANLPKRRGRPPKSETRTNNQITKGTATIDNMNEDRENKNKEAQSNNNQMTKDTATIDSMKENQNHNTKEAQTNNNQITKDTATIDSMKENQSDNTKDAQTSNTKMTKAKDSKSKKALTEKAKSARKTRLKAKFLKTINIINRISSTVMPIAIVKSIKRARMELLELNVNQQKLILELCSKLSSEEICIFLLLIPTTEEEMYFLKEVFLTRQYIDLLFRNIDHNLI